MRARIAEGEERTRLWQGWQAYQGYGNDLDGFARKRSTTVAVVVLEPRTMDVATASTSAT